jgi:hypothetical protein
MAYQINLAMLMGNIEYGTPCVPITPELEYQGLDRGAERAKCKFGFSSGKP